MALQTMQLILSDYLFAQTVKQTLYLFTKTTIVQGTMGFSLNGSEIQGIQRIQEI